MIKNILIAFMLITTVCLGVNAYAATVASPTLDVSWEYPDTVAGLQGFNLYKDGVQVCSTNDPLARAFTCTTQVEQKEYSFTMTAKGTYERESAPGVPVLFTPPNDMFEDLPSPTGLGLSVLINVNVTINP